MPTNGSTLPDQSFSPHVSEGLTELVQFCWVEGLAASTRKKYGGSLAKYLEFCRAHGMVEWEDGAYRNAPFPTEEILMYFACWLKQHKDHQPDTVIGQLSGLASELVAMGRQNPMEDERGIPLKQLKRCLRGLKRKFSKKKKRRDALTMDKLLKVVEHTEQRSDLSPLDKATLCGALCAGVCMMLRVGEIVCDTKKKFDPERNPTLADIGFDVQDVCAQEPSEVSYNISESKTDYYRQQVKLRFVANGSATCAATALAAMVRLRVKLGAKPTDPAFMMSNGNLTRDRLQREMKCSLQAVGMVPGHYSTHSLRIGGATSLAACEGMDADRIRVLGRWSSDCFLLYLRQTKAMLKSTSTMLAGMNVVDWKDLGKEAFNPQTAE